jgi:SnoaL-like domain
MMTDKSLLQRLDLLEAESAIRRLIVAYLEALDRKQDANSIADLFSTEGVWEAVGPLASILGTYRGQEAIKQRHADPATRPSFSLHFLTNESISLERDMARGSWVYLLAATVKERARWIAGRLRGDFIREGGDWKIKHLRVEPIFSTPYEDGWAKTPFAP